MRATVDFRKDAKPGDMLWVWDSWRPRDQKPGLIFQRGVFLLREVVGLNRVSIQLSGAGSFDLKTGIARRAGHSPIHSWAGGEADRQLYRYVLDRHVIARELDRATPEQLKQIADIIGIVPEEPPNAR